MGALACASQARILLVFSDSRASSAGNAAWYVADEPVTNAQSFQGTWLQFANGQTLTGPYRAPTLPPTSAGPVTIQFQGAESAILTLPSGPLSLSRFRF